MAKKGKGQIPMDDRLLAHLRGTDDMGVCIVQAPAAWSRLGPTRVDERGRWWTYGPGVESWGTTRGLAQLATSDDAAPVWHEEGWTCVPAPNIVFYVVDAALNAKYMSRVREIAAQAAELDL